MNYHVSTKEEFIALVKNEILTSAEVTEELGITRQSLSSLVKRGKLTPIKDKLFLREDVERRKEEAKELHSKYRPYDE